MDQPSTDYNDVDTSEYLMTDDSANERQRFFMFTAMAVLAVVVVGALFIWLLLFRGQTEDVATTVSDTDSTGQIVSNGQAYSETVTQSSVPGSILPSTLAVGQDDADQQSADQLPDTGSASPLATTVILSSLAALGHYSFTRSRAKRSTSAVVSR